MAMSLDVDSIVDRRRLRRKITLWRVIAVVGVVVALAAILGAAGGTKIVAQSSAHVARVNIGGLIRNDRDRLELLDDIAKSGAKAVIFSIDSPGGTVAGSEALYGAIRRLNEKLPVVAVIEGVGASGAYITAIGTERIFARRNAIVGSIGVIFQYPNFYQLLKTVGVEVEEVKSSPLKAAPNGYEPTSAEARAAMKSLIDDSYDWFKGLVKERRALDDAQLARASDGRVYTAAQALPLKLVDEIGDERAARAWLAANRNVSADLPVREWKNRSFASEFRWLGVASNVADALGLPVLAELLGGPLAASRVQLDGLLAIWQPSLAN
jgi:protease IV